jgi:predicted anti-sigma-YlaC factor YlaD
MQGHCDRARHWASADVDGELSTFERVLLANHLASCPSCREFRASVGGLTSTLRAAPLERVEVIVMGRIRRRARLRLAPAAAAMAVAVVGLGSILASSAVRAHSVAGIQSVSPDVETMNLSTARALETRHPGNVIRLQRTANRSLRGGPVLLER